MSIPADHSVWISSPTEGQSVTPATFSAAGSENRNTEVYGTYYRPNGTTVDVSQTGLNANSGPWNLTQNFVPDVSGAWQLIVRGNNGGSSTRNFSFSTLISTASKRNRTTKQNAILSQVRETNLGARAKNPTVTNNAPPKRNALCVETDFFAARLFEAPQSLTYDFFGTIKHKSTLPLGLTGPFFALHTKRNNADEPVNLFLSFCMNDLGASDTDRILYLNATTDYDIEHKGVLNFLNLLCTPIGDGAGWRDFHVKVNSTKFDLWFGTSGNTPLKFRDNSFKELSDRTNDVIARLLKIDQDAGTDTFGFLKGVTPEFNGVAPMGFLLVEGAACIKGYVVQ